MTTATPGSCPPCTRGDHRHHSPDLGGICIGCPCPVLITAAQTHQRPPSSRRSCAPIAAAIGCAVAIALVGAFLLVSWYA